MSWALPEAGRERGSHVAAEDVDGGRPPPFQGPLTPLHRFASRTHNLLRPGP